LDRAAVAILTLGCAKNEVDSRSMHGRLEQAGFRVIEHTEQADYVILNTCAFIEAATEESLDTILELCALEQIKSGCARLIVAGCLPSRYREELAIELPEVAAFVPVAQEEEIVHVLKALDAGSTRRLGDATPVSTESGVASPAKAFAKTPAWAYVKISDGCSRHCSYCTIPSIRGPYHDYHYTDIDREIGALTAQGVREIILVGQDTGLWGSSIGFGGKTDNADETLPLHQPQNLAELLDALAQSYPNTWFRVMYLQPEGISDELLKVMESHSNIARYLDIPLQHASAKILASMNRSGSSEEYLALIHRARSFLPDAILRTTVIVGYPGETQEDFDELCNFVRKARFDYVGIFAYSCEEGTIAAGLPHQVESTVASLRLQILRDIADDIGFELVEQKIGKESEVLICGQEEGAVFGRTKEQAPDVDGVIYIEDPLSFVSAAMPQTQLSPGHVIHARLADCVLYDLFAVAIEKAR